MDDASGQLGNNGTEIGYLVSGKNGVRLALSKVAELPPRGAVIQSVTQFVLHSPKSTNGIIYPEICKNLYAYCSAVSHSYLPTALFLCRKL